ncbi:MAG: NAD(P)/FAD-dependent oxidoreductase [Alphaproteobacteria bacterium]|tara:strand:- start:16298 stop:17479 length:1182 start_codon:yes stop_codon:yes gene_type:complete
MIEKFDVVIIGAGAAGMMCAIEAGKRGRKVLLVDHAKKIGEKIRISGGGRCNFTNINSNPNKFISSNPNFCISALKQYTQNDFIGLINRHHIKFHEKKLGQLFCDESSKQIIDMLLHECKISNVILKNETPVLAVSKIDDKYHIKSEAREYLCESLVIATGGLSIPKIGATDFGYKIAKQFHINVIEQEPGLVPLTFQDLLLNKCKNLAGLSLEAVVSFQKKSFEEGMLFTHRGLSGPSILQISSYWKLGKDIQINLAPTKDIHMLLEERKLSNPKQDVTSIISEFIPKRLALSLCEDLKVSGRIADLSKKIIEIVSKSINQWKINPIGTEGYRTAEVTLGGVDTKELSSKTMMSNNNEGLYFIGEVVDVTGHLGGYNFQWAWSSGYVSGQHV